VYTPMTAHICEPRRQQKLLSWHLAMATGKEMVSLPEKRPCDFFASADVLYKHLPINYYYGDG